VATAARAAQDRHPAAPPPAAAAAADADESRHGRRHLLDEIPAGGSKTYRYRIAAVTDPGELEKLRSLNKRAVRRPG
jgi:hypothetical protein